MTVWLLKLVLAPALVVAASLAGRRWGPAISGLMVALPVVAGPVLLVTAVERGQRFGAHAAQTSVLGLVSLCVFVVVFGRLAGAGLSAALAGGWLACLAADVVLVGLPEVATLPSFLLAVAAAVMASRALPTSSGPTSAVDERWWDLPARAVVTAALVATLTGLSAHLGAAVTGVLAPFPVATSVVAAFSLVRHGRPSTLRVLAGVLSGIPAFATFCALVALLLEPVGTGGAFALATAGAALVQAVRLARRGRAPALA